MALTFEYAITAVQTDCSTNTLTDNTVYGNGELERHQLANYVIASKNAVDGTPSYLTVDNLSARNTSGLADLNNYVPSEIVFPTAKDGWYQFIILSAEMYSNATDYVAGTGFSDCSVVYDPADDTFYYAVQNNGPSSTVQGPASDDGTYWVALDLEDTTTWLSLVDNTQLYATYEHNDVVSCYSENCMARLLEDSVDEGLCKDCDQFGQINSYMRVDILVNGMNAKNYEEKQAESEEIARFLENYCASC